MLLLAVVALLLPLAVVAGEVTPPVFRNASARMTLGQDDQIYLANDNIVLHCTRDGTRIGGGVTGPALCNATANPQGIIAAAHAHFSKNVTLYDQNFYTIGRFTRLGDYNFTAPAEVQSGPSGDLYVLDQGRDQIIRFHPDGIRCAVYQIPHDPPLPEKDGYITHFRVCEQTHTLYVLNWGTNLRCFAIDTPEFRYTPRLKWALPTPMCNDLSWGYGGFAVDEDGMLYLMATTGEEFLTCYDQHGVLLKKIPLHMGDHHPTDPTRVLGLCVSRHEAFVKRQHPDELFLRFNLNSGDLLTVATLPGDFAIPPAPPLSPDSGHNIAPVHSSMGIPPNRRKVRRVLFVGNSQVNCVRDIPDMLEEMSRSTSTPRAPLIQADEVIVGGTGLEGYWMNGLAQQRIAAGGWDYVVLNDIVYSFGITSRAKFTEYATKFAALIQRSGAKMVIFATADVEKHRAEHQAMYQDAVNFARTHQCRVVGGGMAWLKAWEQQPALDLHHTDRAHPNALGYYLNACVLYAALTDSNPAAQQLTACDATDDRQAAFLQQIAWTQAREDRKNERAPKR